MWCQGIGDAYTRISADRRRAAVEPSFIEPRGVIMPGFVSRRDMLRQSMLMAGAAATGGLTALHAPRAVAGARLPSETIRFAVLGVNGRGQGHIEEILAVPDCEVAAVCDPDEGVGQRNGVALVEKKTGKRPAFFTDLRRMLEDDSIDAVSIATPNHWHALAGVWAMQAGKDVYVEKPVSHNVREGRLLVESARKLGRICQTGTQNRSDPRYHAMIEVLYSGELGPIRVARALCYKRRKSIGKVGATPVPKGVDYDVWLGPAPLRSDVPRKSLHYDWHWQWEYGNADLGNQGVHEMDVARWGLRETRLPDNVLTFGGRFGYVDDGETPNTEMSIMDYGDRKLIFETRGLEVAPADGGPRVTNLFECEGGTVSPWAIVDQKGRKVRDLQPVPYNHFSNFVEAVRARRHELLTADILEGHLSSALCHLANISYRVGRDYTFDAATRELADDADLRDVFERTKSHLRMNQLDPGELKLRVGPRLVMDVEHERFQNHAAANALLTREYRRGFEIPERV